MEGGVEGGRGGGRGGGQPCYDIDPRHAVVLCRAISQDDQQPLCCEAVVGLLERRRAEQAPVAATVTLRRRLAEDASSGHLGRVEGALWTDDGDSE